MRYRTKIRVFLIVFVILGLDLSTHIEQQFVKLETALQDSERIQVENATDYRDALRAIAVTLYQRESNRVGGYETMKGMEVSALYEAILNGTQDYRSMLEDIRNYFDKRAEYLEDIPSVWPLEYNPVTRITSGFGWRVSPLPDDFTSHYHSGVDMTGVDGAKIIATADGQVKENWLPPGEHDGRMYSGDPELGGCIRIVHPGGIKTVYGHLSVSYVHEDQFVQRGDVIGIMGDTGISTGPHLHYEVWVGGVPVNPLDFLQF